MLLSPVIQPIPGSLNNSEKSHLGINAPNISFATMTRSMVNSFRPWPEAAVSKRSRPHSKPHEPMPSVRDSSVRSTRMLKSFLHLSPASTNLSCQALRGFL
jgi:hypothetical protein